MSDVLTVVYDFANDRTKCNIAETCARLCEHHRAYRRNNKLLSGILDEALMNCQMVPRNVFEYYEINDYYCLLETIASNGELDMFIYLESLGLYNSTDDKDEALHEAARNGHLDMVVHLYETSDAQITDEDRLHDVIAGGNINVLREVLRRQPYFMDIEEKDEWIFCAALSENSDMIKEVISYGATNYRYAIEKAMEVNRDVSLEMLLQYYNVPNSPDLLSAAVRSKSYTIVNMMLDRGADPNAENGQPLREATRAPKDITELLLSRGADINLALKTAGKAERRKLNAMLAKQQSKQ